jgi:PAS domain S-box-containing protein
VATADSFKPPPYLASLVIIENMEVMPHNNWDGFLQDLFQRLRPYGGTIYIPTRGDAANTLRNRLCAMQLEKAEIREVEYDDGLRQGIRYAAEQLRSGDLNQDLAAEIEKMSALLQSEGHLLLVRTGALVGSDDWTHQYGDIANTVKSDDQLVRLPLGVLWFGGNSNTDVLPRHGHGPPEQVIGGRLFIEGMKSLSARDVYTGRVLWKREFSRLNTNGIYYDDTYKDTPLDTAYNQVHIPGANARGTNFVATEDRVYLLLDRSCVVLDSATGKTLDEFTLPSERAGDVQPQWAYIGVYGDYLIAGAEFADYLNHLDLDELDPRMKTRLNSFYNFDIAASKHLVVMNRHTGKAIWSRKAKLGFWHNAIAVADDTIFCIDRLAPSVSGALKLRPGKYRFQLPELIAMRLSDGSVLWRSNRDVFGTWLSCSEENGLLIQAGRSSRDMIRGEPSGISVHSIHDGSVIWTRDISDGGPYILHNDTLITERTAFHMLTGKQKTRIDPLTGEEMPWVFRRDYGCNYIIGSENVLTFRSAAAGFFDLQGDGGTGTFGGFRSSCTSNLIAANGVLNAPDYTRTCSCSYQNQTSLALVHMPELDLWTTYYAQPQTISLADTKIPLLIADPEFSPSYVNSAFRKLFGFSEETELSEISLMSLTESPQTMDEIITALEQKRTWSGILDIQHIDGSSHEVHLMARVLSDEFFAPAAVIFLFADSSESAVAFLNLNGELTHVDDSFVGLWLYGDEQEVLSHSFEQLWEEKEKVRSIINGWKRREEWQGELTALRNDGKKRDVHVITKVVTNETGVAVSAMSTCFDTTERKTLERDASRLVKEVGKGISLKHFLHKKKPLQRLGINFGAPGDRKAENGTLWLEWPTNDGPSPTIQLEIMPDDFRVFRHHSTWIRGNGPRWIAASGITGVSNISLSVKSKSGPEEPPEFQKYDVYLYFVEPEDLDRGERVFDIEIQGEIALSRFDIRREGGGARRTVVQRFQDVLVGNELNIELIPDKNSSLAETVICGIELLAQE